MSGPFRNRTAEVMASPSRRDWSVEVPVPAGLAHTYTECARIWNPIHTDKAVARSAGLPDIILHGTATLALAVSAALERAGAGPAAGIARITCRFTGMVPLPSVMTVEGWDGAGSHGRGSDRVSGARFGWPPRPPRRAAHHGRAA